MDETKPHPGINAGPFTLQRDAQGRLVALHSKFAQPFEVREDQLARWLMRQVRESISLDDLTAKAA
mgnify:CR=1 FL=1